MASALPSSRLIDILLVEDSPTDAMMTQEALEQAKMVNSLHIVTDGVEALKFLRREGAYANQCRPDLILLDLNLPRMNGREVLAEIKEDPALAAIPVVVLSTSHSDEDVVAAYGLHANCYVVKPVDFNAFADIVRSVQDFWFCVVALPRPDHD